MRSCFNNFVEGISRKKSSVNDAENSGRRTLNRCLGIVDLVALGVGSTLGAGIYVVAGQVAMDTAGPAVTVSFFIAAVASILAGLCYAEFGSRVPGSGSGYVYSYVSLGELFGFVTGWNLILAYVIGTASVARAMSSNVDYLLGFPMRRFFVEYIPHLPHLAEYTDLFAGGITFLMSAILSFGVQESSWLNNTFTMINIYVVAYVIVCGLFKANIANWQIPSSDSPAIGKGGFAPFGVSGILSGAGTCFYAFIGFDCIATTGEEARNPQRAIPIATVACLLICFLAYFGISATLTLMMPYYLLDKSAPLAVAFAGVGWPVARYVISIGSICGLTTSIFGCIFPMPRIVYSMARDGLLFHFLSIVHPRFQTPLYATLMSGAIAALLAALFDVGFLLNMMSIGTLFAYSTVAMSVILLRGKVETAPPSHTDEIVLRSVEAMSITSSMSFTCRAAFAPPISRTTHFSQSLLKLLMLFYIVTALVCSYLLTLTITLEVAIAMGSLALVMCVLMITIWRQPTNSEILRFKVPLVPWLPCVSLFVNFHLMMKLPQVTWIYFGVWLLLGFTIYFGYGFWNSKLRGTYSHLEDDTTSSVTSND